MLLFSRLLSSATLIISFITTVISLSDNIATFEVRIGRINFPATNQTFQCSKNSCPINFCLKEFQVNAFSSGCVYGSTTMNYPIATDIQFKLNNLMNDFTVVVGLFESNKANVTVPQILTDTAIPSNLWTTRRVSFAGLDKIEFELSYRIVCADGLAGAKCDQIVEKSIETLNTCSKTCSNGMCNATGSCECFSGYMGPNCDQCVPSAGCQGYCNVPHECICLPNFGGKNCSYDLTKCQTSNMCKNGGICDVDANGAFICRCPSGFTGPSCMTVVRDCASSPCTNNGTCVMLPDKSDFVCECQSGMTGRFCQKRASFCSDFPCFNGARCRNDNDKNSFICECTNNWTGRNCDIPITLCKPDSCVNGAKCINDFSTDLGYRCQCASGFYGARCERRLRDYVGPNAVCKSFTCHNGGVCIQRKGLPMCECPTGFSGFRCETDDNKCHEAQCQNGGFCATTVSRNHCVCPRGFYGAKCQFAMQLLHDTDFFNHSHAPETVTESVPSLWQLIVIVIVVSILISLGTRYIKHVIKRLQPSSTPSTSLSATVSDKTSNDTSEYHQKSVEFVNSAPGAFKNCHQCVSNSPSNPRQKTENRYIDGPWRPSTPEPLREAASKQQLMMHGSLENILQNTYATPPFFNIVKPEPV